MMVARLQPAALCFDFDYPLESQLGKMQTIKRAHTGIPVLMLTVEHSEALAIWAFRARVWNYLVKPVPAQELRANLQVLARIASVPSTQRREVRMPGPAVVSLAKADRPAAAYVSILPAIEHIEQNFGEQVSAAKVARLCGMTPFKFSREFHQAIGNTFQDHLLRYRIAEACRCIRQRPEMPLAEIGFAVGFNDASYFARIFKRYMNMRPSEFARGKSEIDDTLLTPDLALPPSGVLPVRQPVATSRSAISNVRVGIPLDPSSIAHRDAIPVRARLRCRP
ncbi:MAG: DNA-binding response regulator [Steroidobacteraceae bacterium]